MDLLLEVKLKVYIYTRITLLFETFDCVFLL